MKWRESASKRAAYIRSAEQAAAATKRPETASERAKRIAVMHKAMTGRPMEVSK